MQHVVIGVITCKRPEWLSRLLASLLLQQRVLGLKVTVIVVDNASDLTTKEVVDVRSNINPDIPLVYYIEKQPGIVFARNRCVTEFTALNADYLMFIDDDEWLEDEDWIRKMVGAVERFNADVVTSHVVSVGGEGTPAWAIDLIYGNNTLYEGQHTDVFYTNNLLLSRHVIEATLPCFDDRFAMTGASDYHFALRCKHLGFKCVYINSPVKEEFPASRATIKWFCRRGFRSGIGYTRSHLFEEPTLKAVLRCVAMSLVRAVRGMLSLLKGAVTLNKMTWVEGLFRVSSAAGTIAGFFGVKHEEYKIIHGK